MAEVLNTNSVNRVLSAGISYTIGKFQCLLNEESGDLRVIVHTNNESFKVTPKSGNSIIFRIVDNGIRYE